MLKNVRGCATSSGTVVSTSATLLPTGRSSGGQRAPACSVTPTGGTWMPTWSTGGIGRCLNIRGKVVTAGSKKNTNWNGLTHGSSPIEDFETVGPVNGKWVVVVLQR